jgi:hypothetical protein
MPRYWEHAADKGFDWLVEDDLDSFKALVSDKLGIDCPIEYGGTKVSDYRPLLGFLFEEEIAGYDYWGHTDFNCVYGRLDEFYGDDYLHQWDIHSDHDGYIAGPLTLYRNQPSINRLFLRTDEWKRALAQPETTGWGESGFTSIIKKTPYLRSNFKAFHGHRDPSVLHWDENRLMENGKEISFFHFRYTKEWPL